MKKQIRTSWLTKKAQYPTLTDTAAQDTLLREIAAHRAAMDYWGGRMIRDFALDSTGTKTDSVLLWTRHLHRYETDLRLARHAFFSSDFSTYDAWLDSIPARHDLTDAQTDELAEFAAMLAVVRPHAEAETDLYHLPASALDSLAEWASGCNEPGFVAKVLLRRNGREATTDCSGTTAQRPCAVSPAPLGRAPRTGATDHRRYHRGCIPPAARHLLLPHYRYGCGASGDQVGCFTIMLT